MDTTQPAMIGRLGRRPWWERRSAAFLRAEPVRSTGIAVSDNFSKGQILRLGVVVPANNEQDALPDCLDSLRAAAGHVDLPVTVVVVVDSCTDRTAEIVAAVKATTDLVVRSISVNARNVGFSRLTGMVELLRLYPADGTWLATTDADSVVPEEWFAAQLRHAHAGARVVVGTVAVTDWHERSTAVRNRAIDDYHAAPHRHIHGANLSFAAAAYQAAGGFPPITSDEDVALVDAFRVNDEPIAWAMDLPVTTSARRRGRAPRGFADYLTSLETTFDDILENR